MDKLNCKSIDIWAALCDIMPERKHNITLITRNDETAHKPEKFAMFDN